MERKTIMGLAAIGGLGLLLWLRKTAAATETAGASGLLSGAANASGWASSPIVFQTKPQTVADATTANKAPAPQPVATPGGAAAAAGNRFVSGPAGSAGNAGRGEFWYSAVVPNGQEITATVDDPGKIAELRDIREWVQGFNVNDKTQVQSIFDQARATGRSYDEAVADLGAATGYYSSDVGRVASGAGVAKW